MRQVFVDLGANVGQISFDYAIAHPETEIYCVEPTKALIKDINEKAFRAGRMFVTMWGAAWIFDGHVDLFGSGAAEASTIVAGKREINGWPQIDYSHPDAVPCFDFSAWLLRNFNLADYVTVKMDIEGAEYAILEKMIADRSILLVSELICEWHQDRYPEISLERHQAIRDAAARLTKLRDWY